jgi:hypothetical protein
MLVFCIVCVSILFPFQQMQKLGFLIFWTIWVIEVLDSIFFDHKCKSSCKRIYYILKAIFVIDKEKSHCGFCSFDSSFVRMIGFAVNKRLPLLKAVVVCHFDAGEITCKEVSRWDLLVRWQAGFLVKKSNRLHFWKSYLISCKAFFNLVGIRFYCSPTRF